MRSLMISLALFLSVPALSQQSRWAVVDLSDIFMREKPSYTSQNVSQTRMGTLVEILDQTGYWVKIRTPEPYEGWTNELCISEIGGDAERDGYLASERYICIVESTVIHTDPNPYSPRISDFLMGNIIRKGQGRCGAWTEVVTASGRSGWVLCREVADFREWAESAVPSAEGIIRTARLFLGVPYMWGGMSPKHFDCSGLSGFCFFMSGILLPRDASEQVSCGEEIPFEQMQAGDLVFFGDTSVGHVAIATGPGTIIHSSMLVRENSLIPDTPGYYSRNILNIRRILGNAPDGRGCLRIADSPSYFLQ